MTKRASATFYTLLILLVTIVSYGQTILMYFWQDDSALIFKLQHQAEIAGSFGAGLFDRGPYRYLVVPFVPFFPVFKLNPLGYFFIGFLTYLTIVIVMYWLLNLLFKRRNLAFLGTLVVAAGYVGSDTMFRIINSWQTNLGIIFGLVTIGLYVKFFYSRKFKLYFFSLFFYVLSIEFIYIRSHALIASIIAIEIANNIFETINIRKVLLSIVRTIPFFAFFSYWYLQDASFGAPGLKTLLSKIFVEREWTLIFPLLTNIGMVAFPDHLMTQVIYYFRFISIFWFISLITVFAFLVFLSVRKHISKLGFVVVSLFHLVLNLVAFAGYKKQIYYFREPVYLAEVTVAIFLFTIIFALFVSKKAKNIKLVALLGIVTLIAQLGSYYIQYPTSVFWTTHRYFSYAFLGYVLVVFVGVYFLQANKKIMSLAMCFLIIPALYFGFKYQKGLIQDRSIPSRNFYTKLLSFVPSIEKGTIFYFDIARDPYVERQFSDFFSVGSMPDTTALAIYYNVDRYDVSLLTDPDQLFSVLAKDPTLVSKTFAFKYTKEGLVDETVKMRKLFVSSQKLSLKDIPPSDVYLKFAVNLNVSWKSFSNQPKAGKLTFSKIIDAIKSEVTRRQYYSTVKATSESEWSGREIYNIVDKNINTPWQGHRIYWGDNHHDQVTLDLGVNKQVAGITWTNWRSSLTPTKYKILLSTNSYDWKEVLISENGEKKDGEATTITFPKELARFVRVEFIKTLTDDSPSISEIYVFDQTLDPKENLSTIENPFVYARNEVEWLEFIKAFGNTIPIRVKAVTTSASRTEQSAEVLVFPDTQQHSYTFFIPPGGYFLKDLKFETDLPLEIKVNNIVISTLTIEDMIKSDLIKRFSVN